MSSKVVFLSLAQSVYEAAEGVAEFLDANGFEAPSFQEGGLEHYPKDPQFSSLRFKLIDAVSDLYHLSLGPADMGFLQPLFWNHDAMVLSVLNEFDFFSTVPLGGSITYGEIAHQTTLPESMVRRILRHAMTMKFFEEKPPGSGRVAHTSPTAFMAKNSTWRSWLAHNLEEVRPGTVYVPMALKKFHAGNIEPTEDILKAGFAIADFDGTGSPTSFWDYLIRTPEGKQDGYRDHRFSEAMQAVAEASAVKTEVLLTTAFDWSSLGEATVVDVGGSAGHDAVIIARSFPKLKIIVQDLPSNEAKFKSNLPQDLAARITYQKHDFFTPQPTMADVFLLKTILHDWPNSAARAILRNLIPAFRNGTRVLICENVAPSPFDTQELSSLPMTVQRLMSSADLQMLTLYNTMERGIDQWKTLIKQADERLEIRNVFTLPGALRSILEVVLNA